MLKHIQYQTNPKKIINFKEGSEEVQSDSYERPKYEKTSINFPTIEGIVLTDSDSFSQLPKHDAFAATYFSS